MALPNNIADAASQLRDGVLGRFEIVSIGDLVIDALEGQDGTESLNVTRKPIQDGSTMTDAATDEPRFESLTIVLANPELSLEGGLSAAISGDAGAFSETWRDKRDQLYELMRSREIVDVQLPNEILKSCLVESITPAYDVNENYEAFFATVLIGQHDFVGDDASTTGNGFSQAKAEVSDL